MPTLSNTPHRFDLPAIMREAVRIARHEMAVTRRPMRHAWVAVSPCTWAQAMRVGLKRAWADAKAARSYAVWCREQEAERARLTTLSAREQMIARLEHALVGADMIDSYPAMIAAKGEIAGRLLAIKLDRVAA